MHPYYRGLLFFNNAKAVFDAPLFSAASFRYDEQTLNLVISLHY